MKVKYMLKEVRVYKEICDICDEREAEKWYHGSYITCSICGKKLCNLCYVDTISITVCTECYKKYFGNLNNLKTKLSNLVKEVREIKEKIKNEEDELRTLIRNLEKKRNNAF